MIWDEDGTIVTNNHVVAGAENVEVALASGEQLSAEVVATDPLTDLAVLRVDRSGLPAASFARGLPAIGELGCTRQSLGFENTVTAGVVSGLDRALPTGGQTPALVGLIQTDAPISPGNSGGALANAEGEVIGIKVAYLPPQSRAVSIGFAIPAPVVSDVVPELLADGDVEHSFLGVSVAPLTPAVARDFNLDVENGALVMRVVQGGPADRGGLRRGDVIVTVGGEPVEQVEDVYAALRDAEPGDDLSVQVVRDGRRLERAVTLEPRP